MPRQHKGSASAAGPSRRKPKNLRDQPGSSQRLATPSFPHRNTSISAPTPKCTTSYLSNPSQDDRKDILSIDLGTDNYSVCHCRADIGSIVPSSKVHKVRLTSNSNREYIGQMIAAFHEGEWYIGRKLSQERRTRRIPEEKVITNFKLLTYDPYAQEPQVQRVKQQLEEAGQTQEQLIVATLRYIWKDVKAYLGDRVYSSPLYDADKTWVYISVPIMATLQTNKWLADLARVAGLPRITFVYEPLCAAICVIDEVKRKLTESESISRYEGSTALVLDCGGGTSDAVVVRLSERLTTNNDNRVEVVGQPHGELCGSSTIDENFWAWLEGQWNARAGGFQRVVRHLGISAGQIRYQAINNFKPYKEAFPDEPELDNDGWIFIRGKHDKAEQIQLDANIIRQLFEGPVQRIIRLARETMVEDTRLILLCGGLGASIYLQERLAEEFEPDIVVERPEAKWAECPVSAGAPRVRGLMNQSQILARYAVGLVFDNEQFDRKIHKDALIRKRQRNWDVVKVDTWYSEEYKKEFYVVEDRIEWMITQKTQGTVEGNFISSPDSSKHTVQMFHINLEVATLAYTLVFTTRTDIHDHQALRHPDGRLHDGFAVESRTVPLHHNLIESYKRHGWERFLSPGVDETTGRPLPECSHLELYCRFAMKHDNKTISVGYQLVAPECRDYTPNGKLKKNANCGNFDEAEWIEIWDADFAADVLDEPSRSIPKGTEDAAHAYSGPSPTPVPSTERSDTHDRLGPPNRPRLQHAEPSRSESATIVARSPRETSGRPIAGLSSTSASAKRKKGKEREAPDSSKRARKRPAQMSQAQVNVRSNSDTVEAEGSHLVDYETGQYRQ